MAHRDGVDRVALAGLWSASLDQRRVGVEEGALGVLLVRKKGARGENFGPVVTGAFQR
jgi:hypothetical protein